MGLISKLKGIGIAGLIGLASVLPTKNAKANPIIGYTLLNTSNQPVGTNLVVGADYRVGVWFDSTADSTISFNSVGWDLRMPNGASYTNFMFFTGATLPNHNTTEDFFYGFTMDSAYNRVDGTLDSSGVLDDNIRYTDYAPAQGPSNRVGYLGFYDFSTTSVATNKRFQFSPTANAYDTSGKGYPLNMGLNYSQPYFNIIDPPTPLPASIWLTGIAPYFPGFSGPTNCFIINAASQNVKSFALQATSSLADSNSWQDVSTNYTGTTNYLDVVNTSVTNYTTADSEYYRARVIEKFQLYEDPPLGGTSTKKDNKKNIRVTLKRQEQGQTLTDDRQAAHRSTSDPVTQPGSDGELVSRPRVTRSRSDPDR